MKKFLLIALFPFLLTPALAVEDSTPQQLIGPFGTLNNQDDPMVLPNNMAADLLNVEVTDQGKSVRKRKGLGLAFTLPTSTAVVHGIYSFYDATGSDVSLFFNDRYLTSSINGAALTTVFSTNTYDATYQCTDSLGFAYCASTARTPLFKTNGVSYVQIVTVDTGTMVTTTAQRLVQAGFSGSPNQIDFSGANNFTDWTLGGAKTSAYTETISAPGSRITHITAACNGLMWFKDASFGIILNPDDSLNAQNVVLAPEIGTLDNTSVIYPGGIQFRAQDGHIYNFDCSGIEKLTRDITPTINGSGSRRSNSWTQTTQSDWQTGSSSPTAPASALSFTITSGDVVPSSFNVTDSTTGWASGTASNLVVGVSSISLARANGDVTNGSFENGSIDNWTGTGTQLATDAEVNCTINPQAGTKFLESGTVSFPPDNLFAQTQACDGTFISSTTYAYANNSCTWTQRTVDAPGYTGKRIKVSFWLQAGVSFAQYKTSDCFVYSGTPITFYTASDQARVSPPPALYDIAVDNVQNGSSTITTGTFQSQVFNTGLPYGLFYASATWSVNTATPSFILQKSTSSGGRWTEFANSTGTNLSIDRPFVRYISTFTITANDNALSAITGVQLIARSSGTYFSAWKNAPSLTSWDTVTATYGSGDGSHAFYVRSSTSPQSVLNSTIAWVSQSIGGVVSASTGTYFQLIDSFTITSATGTTTSLSDFTFNWFEGTAADKPYAIFFGKDNALWWSVASGSGQSTNNRILRWDLINHGWVIYDIPANGFLIRNGSLYVGSASAGKIYKFGDTDSDAGVAINSYWKSKDFFGDNPLVDKEFRTLSVIAKSVANSTMTVTYTLNASSATAYSLYLYNSASSILRNNRYLPVGRVGNTFNVQFGNNAADQYWELFGSVFKYVLKPWIIGN